MNCGMKATVIEYRSCFDLSLQFEDGYIVKSTRYQTFKNGNIRNPNLKISTFIDKTNEVGINNQGLKMWIKEYRGAFDVDIEFESGYINKNRGYDDFKSGRVKDNYNKEVCGVGYFGDGIHKGRCKKYSTWNKMITRCVNKNNSNRYSWYKDCKIVQEWYNYQNFADWYEENYYECGDEIMCLDKDILVKGNRIYSPNTSIFVPNRINILFTKSDKCRGDYPIGVHKVGNRFTSQCSVVVNNQKKQNPIGSFGTPNEAFNAYKQFKESYIKQVANEYKAKYPNFPQKLYDAMYSYQVEITD